MSELTPYTYDPEDFAEWTNTVRYLKSEDGEITLNDLTSDTYEVEDLARLWLDAQTWKTAANLVERIIHRELSERLNGKSVKVEGWLVWTGVKKDERCHDPEGFHEWLRKAMVLSPLLVERIVNPNSVRVGSLPSEARDTFYVKTERPDAKREAMAAPLEVIEDKRRKRTA